MTTFSYSINKLKLSTVRIRSSTLLSLLFCGVLLLLSCSLLKPLYQTSDDPLMRHIASGTLVVSQPDTHLLFSHSFIGFILSSLYKCSSRIDWYTLYLVLSLTVAFWCYSSSLFENALARTTKTMMALAVAAVYVFAFQYLQFTTVALLCCFSGVLAYRQQGSYWALALVVWSSMIRFEAFLIGLSIAVCFSLVDSFIQKRRLTNNKKLSVLGLTALLAIGLQFLDGKRDPEWDDFRQSNKAAFSITDQKIHLRQPAGRVEQALKEIGWTYEDFNLLTVFFFPDEQIYSGAKLEAISGALRSTESTRSLSEIFTELSAGITYSIFYYQSIAGLFLTTLLLSILLRSSKKTILLYVNMLLVALGILTAFTWFIKFPEHRIIFPVLLCVLIYPAFSPLSKTDETVSLEKSRLFIVVILLFLVVIQSFNLALYFRAVRTETASFNNKYAGYFDPAQVYFCAGGSPTNMTGFTTINYKGLRVFDCSVACQSPVLFSGSAYEQGFTYASLRGKTVNFVVSNVYPYFLSALRESIAFHYGMSLEVLSSTEANGVKFQKIRFH